MWIAKSGLSPIHNLCSIIFGAFSLHPQIFSSTPNNYYFTLNKFLPGRWVKAVNDIYCDQRCIFALFLSELCSPNYFHIVSSLPCLLSPFFLHSASAFWIVICGPCASRWQWSLHVLHSLVTCWSCQLSLKLVRAPYTPISLILFLKVVLFSSLPG